MSENIDNERGQTFTAQKPMTDPTADAAKLWPCQHEVLHFGSGDYYLFCANCNKAWMLRRPQTGTEYDLERGIGGWPEGSGPSPKNGERRLARPQPAPPEGEPDFEKIAEGVRVKFDEPFLLSAQNLSEMVKEGYRLGLAARPKVEEAEGVALCAELRRPSGIGEPLDHSAMHKAADLLERLAGYLSDMTADFQDQAAKLAEREAELKIANDLIASGRA